MACAYWLVGLLSLHRCRFYIRRSSEYKGTSSTTHEDRYIEGGNGCWEREKWFHLSASVEGTVMKVFKNGVAIASTSSGFEPRNVVRNHVYLGKTSYAHGQMFKGSMSDVFIFGGREHVTATPPLAPRLDSSPSPHVVIEASRCDHNATRYTSMVM